MNAKVYRLSSRCPSCKGDGEARPVFGAVICCGFCRGCGIVYAKDGEAARARRDKARDIVRRTMEHYEGIP